jgi:Ca2+-transporting ATPase
MKNPASPASPQPASDPAALSWHAASVGDVLDHLDTLQEIGLTSAEAAARLEKYGPNSLAEKKGTSFLQLVLNQLKGFVVLILIVAAVVSAILGEWVEAVAILTIVVLNAVLGVVQESKAEESLAALKKLAAPEATVIRDGHVVRVPASQLVPGDIVVLEAGNFIPADIRLLEAVNMKVDEASLTGESLPVEKNAALVLDQDIPLGDRKNTSFMGTVVSYGRGRGVVVSTGMHTQLGLIASMLQSVEEEQTPLQRKLDQLGKTLGYACLAICAVVFLVGWLEGGNPLEIFMVAVSLAIAAVPEGLPAIVTISLALGMQEMIKRHALIRKLSSVETLGSATVICSDKTGTLTQNEMTVTRVWVDGTFVSITGTGYKPGGDFMVDEKKVDIKDYPGLGTALWLGALNNDARLEEMKEEGGDPYWRIVGDPTEGALVVAAAKAGCITGELDKSYPRENEVPFDSVRKRMITIHTLQAPSSKDISPFDESKKGKHVVVTVKGGPDLVLGLCSKARRMDSQGEMPLDAARKEQILAANDTLTKDALRVLAVAYKVVDKMPADLSPEELEKDLVFAGLVGMIDPARPEVKPALEKAKGAGIRTIMITGDYPNTARAVAESIGLLRPGHHVLSGAQLDELDDAALKVEVEKTDVFARVSPEHKMRIVSALKENGEVTAMTGDGVNDAPAIKLADIGVSMGITGTDVAKETADMVLTDDNYVSIVSAVEQGRVIYSNIRKFVYYLISCNIAEVLIIFIPTAFGRFLFPEMAARGILSPLTAIQLLWLNLVTDGAPALALGTEKGDPDLMEQPPRPPTEPIINRFMQWGVAVQAIAITSTTLVAFNLGLSHSEPEFAETLAFATLSISELLRAFTSRSERYPIIKIGIFGNKWMNLAVMASLVMILAVIYLPFFNSIFNTLPMGWTEWEIILPLVLIPSIAAELTKWVASRMQKRQQLATAN